jgi:undecaprenyl-diphosphatase
VAPQIVQDAVLGVVQGLTEFLPISSTGHLRVVPAFFGWDDPGAAYTAVVQLGTVLAVVLYFRADLWRITRAFLESLRRAELRGTLDARMGWYVIVATIPIAVAGFVFQDQIEEGARSLYFIGILLIAAGLLLGAADRFGRKARTEGDVNAKDAVVVGLAQAVALIPGTSRSGSTITGALIMGLNREAAARFSFLLSVPAIVLSGLFQLYKIIAEDQPLDSGWGGLLLATALAFVVGYASIAFLLRWLGSHSLWIFVWYRLVLGVVVLALAAAGTIA